MKKHLKNILSIIFFIFITCGFVLYKRYEYFFNDTIKYAGTHHFIGYVLFVILYTASVLIITIPEWPFMVSVGVFFDYWVGVSLIVLGGIMGAMLAFVLGRYFFRKQFHKRVCHTAFFRWTHIKDQKKLMLVAIIARLIPFVPNNLANYVFSLTKIKVFNYFAATLLGIIPCVMLFVYVGNRFSDWLTPTKITVFTTIFVIGMTLYIFKDKLFKHRGSIINLFNS